MEKAATLLLALLLTPNFSSTSCWRNPMLEATSGITASTRTKMKNLGTCVKRIMIRAAQKRVAVFWQPQFVEQNLLMGSLLAELPCDVSLHELSAAERLVFGHSSSTVVETIIFMHGLEYLELLERIIDHVNLDKVQKIVVCLTFELRDEETLERIAEFLWERKIANGVLMTSGEKNIAQLYSYCTMEPPDCRHTKVLLSVRDCNGIDFPLESVFTRKMKNMNNCPIRTSALSIGAAVSVYEENSVLKLKGYEADLFYAIAKAMNFTPVILPPSKQLWGDELPNGTWTGIHGEIQSGVADVAICMITTSSKRLHFEQYSQPFAVDRYIWLLPEARNVNWNNLLQSYHLLVWIAMTLAVLLVFAYLICESYLFEQPIFRNILIIWQILIGDQILWDNTQSGAKILMLVWLLFSFIFMNLHLGDLFSSLAANVRPDNYETTKDLLRNNVPFGGQSTLRTFFNNGDTDDELIHRKFRVIENSRVIKKFFQVIIDNALFAYVSPEIVARPYKNNFNFHIMREVVVTYPSVFAFPRGSPYIDEFDGKILSLNQAGLTDYWIKRNGTSLLKRKSRPKPLNLLNLSSVFVIWLMCIVFAIFVFLCEKIVSKKCRKMS